MKQRSGKAGTPRQFVWKLTEEPEGFRFRDSEHATQFILGRGRTQEQLVRLVAAADMGLAIAQLVPALRDCQWLVQPRGALRRRIASQPDIAVQLARKPPSASARALVAPLAFANLAIDVVNATRPLITSATRLAALFDGNPQLKRGLRQWSSPLQMMTALTASAAETMSLTPDLSPREMEAVTLIVGYRPVREEFGETRLREDAWRKLLKTVRRNLLPQIRSLQVP